MVKYFSQRPDIARPQKAALLALLSQGLRCFGEWKFNKFFIKLATCAQPFRTVIQNVLYKTRFVTVLHSGYVKISHDLLQPRQVHLNTEPLCCKANAQSFPLIELSE